MVYYCNFNPHFSFAFTVLITSLLSSSDSLLSSKGFSFKVVSKYEFILAIDKIFFCSSPIIQFQFHPVEKNLEFRHCLKIPIWHWIVSIMSETECFKHKSNSRSTLLPNGIFCCLYLFTWLYQQATAATDRTSTNRRYIVIGCLANYFVLLYSYVYPHVTIPSWSYPSNFATFFYLFYSKLI